RQLPSYLEGPDGKLYSNDEFLHSYVSQLLSTLIVVPVGDTVLERSTFQPTSVPPFQDNPELGFLYLFKGLYNVLKEYKFESSSNYKILIWMNLIRYLVTCTLDDYPYHVDGGTSCSPLPSGSNRLIPS